MFKKNDNVIFKVEDLYNYLTDYVRYIDDANGEYGFVRYSNDNGNEYFDYWSNGQMLVCDGEVCIVKEVTDNYIVLMNKDEVEHEIFMLSVDEARSCLVKCG